MSVRIISMEQLDSNIYNRVVIRQVKDDFFVRVSGEKTTDEYKPISYKLSDNFRGIDSDIKILEIVESVLENMRVDTIKMSVSIPGYSNKFIKVGGTRELYLQIYNQELLKKLVKMIIDKYNRDRYKYCSLDNNHKSYNIFLDRNESFYGSKFISCDRWGNCNQSDETVLNCPKNIEFKLMFVNGKIVAFDYKFITRFVYDKLWEIGKEAILVTETENINLADGTKVGESIQAYCIICDNLIIRFNCSVFTKNYVLNICNKLLDRYNSELNEIEKVKKRQLKLEGF